jgi:hypothetical protein
MMKLKKKLILRVLLVYVIASLICAASLSATTGEVEITGVIFPVVLAGEDGEMYAISIDGKCVELIEHENKFVKLIGTVAIGKSGGKTITVKHYEVLKDWPQGS